jgi:hypothetical protein
MFNHTTSRLEDVRRMVSSLNNELEDFKVQDAVLASTFEKFWPDLERRLQGIHTEALATAAAPTRGPQDQTEMVSEILTVVRDTSRSLATIASSGRLQQPESRRVRDIVMSRLGDRLRELGVRWQQMGMPAEVAGGITIKLNEREIEIPIGEAADVVDGIVRPVDFLKRIGALE